MLFSIANVSTWTYTGYNMIILYAALRSIPSELYEAAAVDGAGRGQDGDPHQAAAAAPGASCCAAIFSVIGSFQLFAEPQIFCSIAPGGDRQGLHAEPLRLQPRVRRPATELRGRPVVPARGLVVFVVSYFVMYASRRQEETMSAVPTAPPDVGAAVTPTQGERKRVGAAPGRRRGLPASDAVHAGVPDLLPDAAGVAVHRRPRSRIDDLFGSFGLWFSDFSLFDNISDDVLEGRRRVSRLGCATRSCTPWSAPSARRCCRRSPATGSPSSTSGART